jgi:hypothetical protein
MRWWTFSIFLMTMMLFSVSSRVNMGRGAIHSLSYPQSSTLPTTTVSTRGLYGFALRNPLNGLIYSILFCGLIAQRNGPGTRA